MELEFEQDTIACYETLTETTLYQEESQESIVPDACPDILRIVKVCSQASIRKKQVKDGTALVSGIVQISVLYLTDEDNGICHMDAAVPFTCQISVSSLNDQGKIIASPYVCRAEARVLNPRKVLLHVDLAVSLTVCQPIKQSFCCGAIDGAADGICQKQFQGEHCYLVDVQEKPFVVEDQIRLKISQGETPRLLHSRIVPYCTESKLIGNKLIFKGSSEVSLLFREPDGTLFSTRESIPFSQIMEISGGGEHSVCQVDVAISDFHYTSDLEDSQALKLELELLAQAQVHCCRELILLQDLYSTLYEADCTQQDQFLCHPAEVSVIPQAVRDLLESETGVHSLIDSTLTLAPVRQSRDEDDTVLTSDALLSVLYLDENEQIRCSEKIVPVSCRVRCPEQAICFCHCSSSGDLYSSPTAGGIEVRFNAEFHCITMIPYTVTSIVSAALGELRGRGEHHRPSIVLRLSSKEESLWDIAKAYGTTTEEIIQANELDSDTPPVGTMLLIPSTRS